MTTPPTSKIIKLITLIAITLIGYLPLSLNAQVLSKFTSRNDPKAKGLSFTIEHPITWKPILPDRPNVVAKIMTDNGNESQTLIILIKKLPGIPDANNLQYLRKVMSSDEVTKGLQGTNTFLSGSSTTVLDGLPASTVLYTSTNRVLETQITVCNLTYTVFYKDFYITLLFGVQGENSIKTLKEMRPLFERMARTFILLTQYE